jgi:sterol desaturase/sphingolipid hydroxylase (fatty acid hydroxylase superfamily)
MMILLMITAAAALLGAFTWSFAEYQLHRFVGHGRGRSLFAREHRQHHAVGDYFAPSWKKALNVGPVLLAVTIGGTYYLGVVGAAYGAGLAIAYIGYELFHRRLHTHAPRGRFGRWARRHHFHHHFHDPAGNHGVTTPVFDVLFRTQRISHTPIRVPARLAMRWLIDPASGDIRKEFRSEYELKLPASQAPEGSSRTGAR